MHAILAVHRPLYCLTTVLLARQEFAGGDDHVNCNLGKWLSAFKTDNQALAAMFKEIRREQGLSSPYVFTWGGHTVKQVDRGFRAACTRAGIDGVRFHDLRHTFASQLVIKGASLQEVKELLGHKSLNMTLRYAHLAKDQTKIAVNLLNGLGTLCQTDRVKNMANNAN